jgi:hypothetical protein
MKSLITESNSSSFQAQAVLSHSINARWTVSERCDAEMQKAGTHLRSKVYLFGCLDLAENHTLINTGWSSYAKAKNSIHDHITNSARL